jgi:hypothetical protein
MKGSQIRAYAAMNRDPNEYRKNKQSATTALKYIDDSSCECRRLPYSCVSTDEFEQWAIETNFEQWHEEEIERNRFQVDEKYKKIQEMLAKMLQFNNCDDPKKTVRRITVQSSPMCSIPLQQVEEFWASRWSQNPPFEYDNVNQLYPIKEVFNQELNERFIMQLLDLEAMVALITKRGNFSAPGLDGITFPFLKLEKDSAARMIIEMIRFMIFHKKSPTFGKWARQSLFIKQEILMIQETGGQSLSLQ